MSDEKRNISDINDQKTIDRTEQAALDQTAEQQAFSEEIRRRLAAPDSGKPTLEEFKVMVYKDREKRRKKRNTLAACLVAAFIVGFLSFDALVPEVGADKNTKETIVTEDGVIIEDGGYGSSEEEDNTFIIDDWEHVADVKTISSKLLIPGYMPKGYKFEQLEVETIETGAITCEYTFSNQNTTVEVDVYIPENNLNSFDVNEYNRVLSAQMGNIYILKEEKKIAIINMDDGITVSIWCELSDSEIVKIVNGMSN